MGYDISKPLTINGFTNLLTALLAAGYSGTATLIHSGSVLQNMNAAVDCYFHGTGDSGSSAGLTGTHGIPFGPDLGVSILYALPKGSDLSTIWLFAASSITVNATIRG